MNDDFENQLHELAGKLERHDPTAGWKIGILSRASCEPAPEPAVHAPRWLLASLAAAWVGIAFLRFTTPDTARTHDTAPVAAAAPAPFAPATTPDAPLRGLVVLNHRHLLP